MTTTPEFGLDKSLYDQSTYKGRLLGFLNVVDPRLLLLSDEEIRASEALLKDFEAGKRHDGVTDEDLWAAKKVVEGTINSGSGEIIPAPVRMSGFVPANVPMVAGMINSTGIVGTLFWQWANQSYNSATNYANRAGSDMSTEQIMTSYGIAVGTSCGLAMGLRWLGSSGPAIFRTMARVPFIVPYIAVAGAGAANVYFSRLPEIENGVMVKSSDGKNLGISKEAGRQGVMQTILSRSLGLPVPVILVPAMTMAALPKTLPKRTLIAAEVLVITGSLLFALPMTLAIFPQKLELDVQALEPEFQNLVDSNGLPINKVYSNKGL